MWYFGLAILGSHGVIRKGAVRSSQIRPDNPCDVFRQVGQKPDRPQIVRSRISGIFRRSTRPTV
jgi:hypothetical protein